MELKIKIKCLESEKKVIYRKVDIFNQDSWSNDNCVCENISHSQSCIGLVASNNRIST